MLTDRQKQLIKEVFGAYGKKGTEIQLAGLSKSEISKRMRMVRYGYSWAKKKKQDKLKNNN